MNAETCLSMLRSIRDVAFATVDQKGRPQVRIIDVMLVEKEKLYFCTARGKEFYRQLTEDGHVAIVGMTDAYEMIRLDGRAVWLENQKEWIDRIFLENPNMNAVYPDSSRYVLEAFYVEQGQVELFDLSGSPIVRACFPLGGAEPEPKGFLITKSCIGCGKCKAACPQQCIEAGRPFSIRQEHCLHCGLCAELCPTTSIVRRNAHAQ